MIDITVDQLSKRDARMLYLARLCSQKSKYRIQIGAVVAKGKYAIGLGWNHTDKTHPEAKQDFNFLHAELDATVGENRDLMKNATIYVYRYAGICKPCEHCQKMLFALGIKRIVYTYAGADGNTAVAEMRRGLAGFYDWP